MILRIALAAVFVALASLFAWLASHRSDDAIILGRYSPAYAALLAALGSGVMLSLLVQARPFYPALYKARREIGLVAVSALGSLLALEAAVRAFDLLGVSYFAESSRYHLDKIADPELVYRHAPNVTRTYQGVEVAINGMGLREREIAAKKHDELRVLLLGDSVTFGWGVPIEATFGRKLEDKLTTRLERTVRTINSGVGSYNTEQEYAFLRKHGATLAPDIAIVLYVANDIETVYPPFDPWSELSLRGKSPPQSLQILLRESWLYRLANFVLRYSNASESPRFDPKAEGVIRSMTALTNIADFCRERDTALALFFYRKKGETAPDGGGLLTEVRSIGRKNNFLIADVGEWWGDVDMRELTRSPVDSHPNARGHEILATTMAEFLLTHLLLQKTPAQ